jgi:glutathione S-transferase
MRYILHATRRCPFCIRVRILLYLKHIEYEAVEEPLRLWTPWMKEWGARTGERIQVPVLRAIHEDGKETVYTESNDINEMLDKTVEGVKFTPLSIDTYQEMRNWFLWCDTILKPQIDLYKYGENLKFDKDAHNGHTQKLEEMLRVLETALETRTYLLEERLTLADIAIIPFIRQIMRTREGEFDFTPFPQVRRWTLALIDTDWFTDVVMKK